MFTVYGIPGSPFMRAVLAALVEKDQPWRLAAVAPGTSKQPEHLARHPFGRIPAVEHDGFALYETQAVLRYIDQVFPHPPLTPRDPGAAARMNQAIGVNDWYLFRSVGAGIVFPEAITHTVVAASLSGAILWNLFTLILGLPSSSSHALIGSVRGRQTQSLLHRIDDMIGRATPRIALSATFGDTAMAERFLRPDGALPCVSIDGRQGGAELRMQVGQLKMLRLHEHALVPVDPLLVVHGHQFPIF